jgi:hypothetical protein
MTSNVARAEFSSAHEEARELKKIGETVFFGMNRGACGYLSIMTSNVA